MELEDGGASARLHTCTPARLHTCAPARLKAQIIQSVVRLMT
jgi:hypothetical protein